MTAAAMRSLAAALACSLALGGGMSGCEGGTSSETVGVANAGKVEATAGRDAIAGRTDSGNVLGLYSADFLPHLDSGYAKTVTADSAGAFAFASLAPGRYRLLVRRPSDSAAALLHEITVPAGSDSVSRATLEPTGELSGIITDSLSAFLGLIYAPGTPFFALGDSLMRYELKGLPAGGYPLVKTWKRMPPCGPGKTCGGLETRQDSAVVQIRPGKRAVW